MSLPANVFQPYSGVKTSILVFQKVAESTAAGSEPRTPEVWFYEINDEAFSLDQKRKAQYGRDNDLWDALVKFQKWHLYRRGEAEELTGKQHTSNKNASIADVYYQPQYWEERWRSVDDEFLKVFPEKSGDKDHTFPLHELWPSDFPFEKNALGARRYDEEVIARVKPVFEKHFLTLVERTVAAQRENTRPPNAETVVAAAEKNVKAVVNQLNKIVRDRGLLDREFDQFGQNALKTVLKEMTDSVGKWVEALNVSQKKSRPDIGEPSVVETVEALGPCLTEFARIDGYNVWRQSSDRQLYPGKLSTSEDGTVSRQPACMSWIMPVRKWAELKCWGEDPKTKKTNEKPTHKDGLIDPEYLAWLRDTLRVFNDDGTVKSDFVAARLDPDCLEALDFNLSAGRHKPFVFDAGQHRPPAELIRELQGVHGEIQSRLTELLNKVVGK